MRMNEMKINNHVGEIGRSKDSHIDVEDEANKAACKQKNEKDLTVTTTISTIALQSGDTRLVIALLQSGGLLKLKVLELDPDLASLGDNVEAASSLASAHDQVLIKLQSKQSPVEELLRQADHLISTQTPRAEIYAAMADSLGQTWKDVNTLLDLRKQILDQNLSFQCRAEEFYVNAKALNILCSVDSQLPINIESIRDMINKINELKTLMLNSLLRALNEGGILLEKLISIRSLETLDFLSNDMEGNIEHAVHCVERWLEMIHEQRKISDLFFHRRKAELEECLALALIAMDLKNMEIIVNDKIAILNCCKNPLGDSKMSAELLLFELTKLQQEANQLQKRLLKITKTSERLKSINHFTTEQAITQAYTILEIVTNYMSNLEIYENLLRRAVGFYESAEKVFSELNEWQMKIESHAIDDYESLKFSVLEITSHLLNEGYAILDANGSISESDAVAGRGDGIEKILKALENRKNHVLDLCAEADRNNAMSNVLMNNYNELEKWLRDFVDDFLCKYCNIGETLSEARSFNDEHCSFFEKIKKQQQSIEESMGKISILKSRVNCESDDMVDQWLTLQIAYEETHRIIKARIELSYLFITLIEYADAFIKVSDEISHNTDVQKTINVIDESEIEKINNMWIQAQNLHSKLETKSDIFIERIEKNDDPYLNKPKIISSMENMLKNIHGRRIIIAESLENWKTLLMNIKECEIQQILALSKSKKIIERVQDWRAKLYPILSKVEAVKPKALLDHIEEAKNKRLVELKKLVTDMELLMDNNGKEFRQVHDDIQQTRDSYDNIVEIFAQICKNLEQLESKTAEVEKVVAELEATLTTDNESLHFDSASAREKIQKVETMITTIEEALRERSIRMHLDSIHSLCIQDKALIMSDVGKIDRISNAISLYSINTCSQVNLKIQNFLNYCNFVDSLTLIDAEMHKLNNEFHQRHQSNWWANRSYDFVKKFTSNDLVQYEATIRAIYIKINQMGSSSMEIKKFITNPQTFPNMDRRLEGFEEKWNKLDSSFRRMEKFVYKIVEYFKLLEETEKWYKKLNELLKTVKFNDSFNVNISYESQKLLKEIEKYIETSEDFQNERIEKLRSLSTELFGTERLPQFNKVIIGNQATLDLYTITISELRILNENVGRTKRPAAANHDEDDDILRTTIKIPKLSEPVLVEELKNKTSLDEGQTLELSCKIQDGQNCRISWYKDGNPIVDKPRYSTCIVHENLPNDVVLTCSLGIEKISAEDCGEYKCRASNVVGSIETSIIVDIRKNEVEHNKEPVFVKLLESMMVEKGSSPTMECIVEGNPLPTVQWYRNQMNIDHMPDYIITYNNGQAKLKFLEVTPDDAGIYSCKAYNKYGNAVTSALIQLFDESTSHNKSHLNMGKCKKLEDDVHRAPIITKPLKDIEVELGHSAKFDCTVIGEPEPEVIWYHNNQLIKESSDFELLFQDDKCCLIIREVVADDAGNYKVVAINERGATNSQCTLSVVSELSENTKSIIIPPSFNEPLKTHYDIGTEEPIKLECTVSGQPAPKITWLFNSKPIINGKDLRISVDGNCQRLDISGIRDAGSISCHAENIAGSAICTTRLETGATDKVTKETCAKESSEILVPDEIVMQSLNSCEKLIETEPHQLGQVNIAKMSSIIQSTTKNSSLEEYKLTTKSNLSETNDNKSIMSNNIQNGGKSPSLQTYKVEEFERIMQNSPNKIEQERIKIISETRPKVQKQARKTIPPRFISPLTGMIVDQGSHVILEGAIDGFPEPTITWSKNGQDLKENIKTSVDHGHVRLELRNVNIRDAGRYTCTAVNELGDASSTADLVVKKTTFPPVFGKRLQAQVAKAGERVIMEVEITGTPEPNVTWYKDDEPLMDTDGELKQLGNCYILIIDKVGKRHAGKYMVNASNSGGEAQSIADFAVFEPIPDTMVEVHKTMVYENIADKDVKLDEKKSQLPTAALTAEHVATTMIQPSSTLKTLIPTSGLTSSSIRRIEMIQPQIEVLKKEKESIDAAVVEKAMRSEMVSATIESHQSETKSEQKFHMKLEHEAPDLIFDRSTSIGNLQSANASNKGDISKKKESSSSKDDVEDEDKRYDVKVDKLTKNYERATKFMETKQEESSSHCSKSFGTDNVVSTEPSGIKSIDFPFDACKLPLLNTQRTILEDTTASGSPIHGTLTISKLAAQSESAEKMLSGFNLTPGPPPEIGYISDKKFDENRTKTIQFEDKKKNEETCDKWWSSTSDLETRSHISTDLSEYRCPSDLSFSHSERPLSPRIDKNFGNKPDINRKSWPPSSNICPLKKNNDNDQTVCSTKESLSQQLPEIVRKVASSEKRETIENDAGGGITKTNVESSTSLETRSWSTKENRIELIDAKSATIPREFQANKKLSSFGNFPTSGQIYKAETIKVDHTSNLNTRDERKYSSQCEVQRHSGADQSSISKFSELKAPQLVKRASVGKPPEFVQLYHPLNMDINPPRCDEIREFQTSSSIFKGTLATAPRHNSFTGAKAKSFILDDSCMVLEPGPPPEIGYMPPSILKSDSDNREPKYRKVKAPTPKSLWPQSLGPEPLPPSSFQIPPPEFTGPPRPFVSQQQQPSHSSTSDNIFGSSVHKPLEKSILSNKEMKGPFKFVEGECMKSDLGKTNYASGQSILSCTAPDDVRAGSCSTPLGAGVDIIQPYLDILPKKPPLFTTPLRDIAVMKNQTARFECIVEAEPQPQISWSINGEMLHNSSNYEIYYRNGVCRLVIPVAYVGDSGTYTCNARNCLGSSATTGTLHVKETVRYG